MPESVVPSERMSSVFLMRIGKPLIYWNVDDYMEYCEPDQLQIEDLAYDRVFLLIPGTIQDHDNPDPKVAEHRAPLESEFSTWVYPFMFPAGDHITGLFVHTNGVIPDRLAVLVKEYYDADAG
jgi:hypothetical protein